MPYTCPPHEVLYVNILYMKNLLGIMYVEALSNTLWFVNSTHFRFKGYQEQWQMTSKGRCSTYQRSGRKWIFRIFQTTYEQCETFDKTKYSDTLYLYNSRLLAYMTTGNLLKLVNSCSMILTINFMHNFLIRYPWTSWSCYRQATGKTPSCTQPIHFLH